MRGAAEDVPQSGVKLLSRDELPVRPGDDSARGPPVTEESLCDGLAAATSANQAPRSRLWTVLLRALAVWPT